MDVVSVVVPVYNAEKTLRRCIVSVLNSTYSQVELLLVNDGSKDRSGRICDEYEQNDARVRVIHKENGGVSSARNVGLQHVEGRYVLFLDSDDWLPHNAIQLHIDAMKKNSVQLTSLLYVEPGIKSSWDVSHSTEVINIRDYGERGVLSIANLGTVTARMYDINIIRQNNIHFYSEIKYSEDTIFMWEYLKFCKNICNINDIGYYCDPVLFGNPAYKYYKYNDKFSKWYCRAFSTLLDLYAVHEIKNVANAKEFESFLRHGFAFCVISYMSLNDENKAKERIRECLLDFEDYILYCEEQMSSIHESLNHILYTRDVDLIYNKYYTISKRNPFKEWLRVMAKKVIYPFVERKYTKLVMAGKM